MEVVAGAARVALDRAEVVHHHRAGHAQRGALPALAASLSRLAAVGATVIRLGDGGGEPAADEGWQDRERAVELAPTSGAVHLVVRHPDAAAGGVRLGGHRPIAAARTVTGSRSTPRAASDREHHEGAECHQASRHWRRVTLPVVTGACLCLRRPGSLSPLVTDGGDVGQTASVPYRHCYGPTPP